MKLFRNCKISWISVGGRVKGTTVDFHYSSYRHTFMTFDSSTSVKDYSWKIFSLSFNSPYSPTNQQPLRISKTLSFRSFFCLCLSLFESSKATQNSSKKFSSSFCQFPQNSKLSKKTKRSWNIKVRHFKMAVFTYILQKSFKLILFEQEKR